MVDYSNPFLTSFRGSRNQFTQPQNQQNQYDFSGWGDRLGKIEEGIASLTDQFKNFQTPGDVAPEYTGNAAPEPLEQPVNETGIESLMAEPEPLGGLAELGALYAPGFTGLEPQPTSSAPTPTTPMGGQSLSISGPLSLTQKLQNEYLMETKGPLTMGNEWDARAKEMGFDFAEQRRQGHKGRLSSGWTGTGQGPDDRFNQLFEEAGGVLDRPEMGAAARYGEGFTNWLSGKGYEVYTEPQQEWMTQSQGGLGAFGRDDLGQDTSGYIPHLSQYAMTAEEMKDPTGTLEARRNKLYQPSGDVDMGGIPGLDRGLERLGPFDPTALQIQYQGRPNDLEQPIGGPTREQQYQQLQAQSQALQAGVGALQGPTQQKIKQGLGAGI